MAEVIQTCLGPRAMLKVVCEYDGMENVCMSVTAVADVDGSNGRYSDDQ